MFGHAAFSTPGAHSWDLRIVALLLGAVGSRGQLDEGVQRDGHPWGISLGLLHEVGVDASQHSLVRNDEDVLRALQLHDDGLQTNNNVAIRLTASIAIVVLVVVASCKVLGVQLRDLLVGESVADTRVELIQSLPLKLVVVLGHEAGGGSRAPQRGGPYGERAVILRELA